MKNITIAGRLGRDAETRYTTGGNSVTEFSVAVDQKNDKKNPVWFRVSLWGAFGEKLAQYLTKGTAVVVQGDFHARQYESGGETRMSLEVTGRDLQLMGGGNGNRRNEFPEEETEKQPVSSSTSSTYTSTDEDIPF